MTQASQLPSNLESKWDTLVDLIRSFDSCVVAFSGGVDSALLLKASVLALGERAIAATGLSETYAPEEMEEARAVAAEIGAVHVMVRTMELTDPRYANNSHQRCFFCKTELYTQLQAYAKQHGYATVVDGTNADDLGDFRPGIRAANKLGVRSPLQEAGLHKQEIRDLSQWLALPTWNKPAAACLSSRFAYGDPITVEKLSQVAKAESHIRRLGYRGFRVRHHEEIARIEMPTEHIADAIADREEIARGVRAAGYRYVTIDLEGYQTGRMNEGLNARLQSH
ncbi:MAG: ATP-dependent sacrificial sulfur transferase LarE [Thermomicrobiales bacterium]|nr:ATP-dependent sacrificial sulfur transferase LarE [Thermomicrobiales bacterium]